jgi:hypothetical protein
MTNIPAAVRSHSHQSPVPKKMRTTPATKMVTKPKRERKNPAPLRDSNEVRPSARDTNPQLLRKFEGDC